MKVSNNHIIDFYFDFMSPFSYLAHLRLPNLARQFECKLDYHPIDLPAAKLAAGNTGPPNVKIPIKLQYLTSDLDRWAARYGAPIKFPPSLDSRMVNCGTFFADKRSQTEDYVQKTWKRIWGNGEDMSDLAVLSQIAGDMGWRPDEFLDFVCSDNVLEQYDQSNANAQQVGVFGAPTMILDGQMWWGNDRLDFLRDFLKNKQNRGFEK